MNKQDIQTKQEETGLDNRAIAQAISGCKLIHVQILKTLYTKGYPLMYLEIWNAYKNLRLSDQTLRKRIKELEDLKLIEVIHSNRLLLVPMSKIKEEVIGEINKYYTNLNFV